MRPVFQSRPDNLFQCGDFLAAVISAAKFVFPCLGQCQVRYFAASVRCLIDRFVMQDHRDIVLCEADICFEGAESEFLRQVKSGKRVLRSVSGRSPVGDLEETGRRIQAGGSADILQGCLITGVLCRSYFYSGNDIPEIFICKTASVSFPDLYRGVYAFGNDHAGTVSAQILSGIDIV